MCTSSVKQLGALHFVFAVIPTAIAFQIFVAQCYVMLPCSLQSFFCVVYIAMACIDSWLKLFSTAVVLKYICINSFNALLLIAVLNASAFDFTSSHPFDI